MSRVKRSGFLPKFKVFSTKFKLAMAVDGYFAFFCGSMRKALLMAAILSVGIAGRSQTVITDSVNRLLKGH